VLDQDGTDHTLDSVATITTTPALTPQILAVVADAILPRSFS
jgi:hypothetical protein